MAKNPESIRKLTVTGEAGTYYVTLPKKIVRILDWRKGTIVSIKQKGSRIIIRKKR